MSDPFTGRPQEKQDPVEKKAADGQQAKDGVLAELRQLANQKLKDERGAAKIDPNIDKALGKLDLEFSTRANTQFTLPFGQSRPFQLQIRKSEFTKVDEKPIGDLKPMIDNFLKVTRTADDEKHSNAANTELNRTRDNLANATNKDDAISNVLQLASLYSHLRYIEEAKQAINLALGLDPNNLHGKQLFKELERMHPADIGAAAAAISEQTLTKSNLRKRIANLAGGRVIVLGDLLIDELLEGSPERISREAPVLILEHVDTQLIPGGAANTANNVAALGGTCHAIGICGSDEYAGKLRKLFDDHRIKHSLVEDPTRPTTVKTRILSKSHSFRQQLLRLDRISHKPIGQHIEDRLVEKLAEVAGEYKAVILSDYKGGVMTDGLIRSCRRLAAEHKLMVIVDAQGDFARFQDVTLLTPNQPDCEGALGFSIDSRESLANAGQQLLMMTGTQALLITRGGSGMVLFQQGQPMVELPAFNRSEVFDVTGAGDTVVATMALALVTGSNFVEAMALGNLAAGIVVKKPGTAVTNQAEMLEILELLKIQE